MEENKNLKGRVAKLEVNQLQKSLNLEKQPNTDIETLKSEVKELQTTYSRNTNSSNRELQLIKQELENSERQYLLETNFSQAH